jgi:hypothetical protein
LQDIRLPGVILANEASDSRCDFNIKMPKISKILNEQTTDEHREACISPTSSAWFCGQLPDKPPRTT